MLTQKRLREVLHYNPETGIFRFTKGTRKGKLAGTLHDHRGYLKVSIDNERHMLHRLAWLWMTGLHSRSTIEHKNGDTCDNTWSNLREGLGWARETHRAPFPEPTQFRGVYQVGDRFEALIPVASEVLNIGSFSTAEDARDAIDQQFKAVIAKRRELARNAA